MARHVNDGRFPPKETWNTIQYGRLSGSLRQSRKTLASATLAKTEAKKLISKKRQDGYVEIDASRVELTRPKGLRKATEKQIATLEKELGEALPSEYRSFLASTNGGRVNPGFVCVPARQDIDNVEVGNIFHLRPSKPEQNELTYEIERTKSLLPAGYLPIAGGSDLFAISLKPKTFGAVFWWFHESNDLDDDGNFLETAGHLLAGSFNEFLTRIACVFEDESSDDQLWVVAPKKRSKTTKVSIRKLIAAVQHDHTPAKVKQIRSLVQENGDLSQIQDGQWPFINFRDVSVLKVLASGRAEPRNH